jgi:hypothetical protein
MSEKLSDEEIVRRQQELYDLETGAMAGRLGTPEEQLQKIKAFFAEIRARKRQEESEKKIQA